MTRPTLTLLMLPAWTYAAAAPRVIETTLHAGNNGQPSQINAPSLKTPALNWRA